MTKDIGTNQREFWELASQPGAIIMRRDILFEIVSIATYRTLTAGDASWFGMNPGDKIPERIVAKQLNRSSGNLVKNPKSKHIYIGYGAKLPTQQLLSKYIACAKQQIESINAAIKNNNQLKETI